MAVLAYFKKHRNKIYPLLVIIICIYALYLRAEWRAGCKLWIDERVQIERMDKPFWDFVRAIPEHQYCGWLAGDYFVTWPFARLFPNNKWGIGIPHIISTILGFWLLYLICKRYFKSIWGYLITFTVVCFNQTLLQHAFEIRRYAILPTLALGCLYLAFKLVDQNIRMRVRNKWITGIFFALVVWFDIYGIVILFLPVLFALSTKRRNPAFAVIVKHTIKFMAVIICVTMPLWLYSVFGPHNTFGVYDPFEYIPNPLQDTIGFLKGVFANLIGYRYKILYVLLAGVIFPFILPYKKRFQQIAFLLILVFIPLGVILTVDVIKKYWFIQRQFIWVMPFFALFLGWSWESAISYVKGKIIRGKNA